jgi:hypothetical protein
LEHGRCICGTPSTNIVVFLFEHVRRSNVIMWSVFKEGGGWLWRLQHKYRATPWGSSFLPWCVNVVLVVTAIFGPFNWRVSGYKAL